MGAENGSVPSPATCGQPSQAQLRAHQEGPGLVGSALAAH